MSGYLATRVSRFTEHGLTRWTLTIATLLLLTALVWQLHRTVLPADVLVMADADYVTHAGDSVPAAELAWRRIALPDDWHHRAADEAEGWYRFRLELNVPPNRLWGVYLPSLSMNAAVYLNGELLGSGGRFESPVARNWNRPLYFGIPNGLLRPGENVLHVRLKTEPARHGLLAPVLLGPAEALLPAYEHRLLVRYVSSQMIVAVLVVMGAFMYVLWLRRRQDPLYLWYAVTCMVWAAHSLNLIVINIPMSARLWDWLVYVTILWVPIFTVYFIHRFLGLRRFAIERGLVVLGIMLSLLLAVMPAQYFYVFGSRGIDSLALGLGLYPLGMMLVHCLKNPRFDALLLLSGGAWMMLLGTHDALFINHLLSREDGLLLHYSAPLVLFAFASILLKQFVGVLGEAETLNRELEQRVQQKHRELEHNYASMQQIERQKLLAEERERLLRDMHDGMGGYLVSTLALVDGGVVDAKLLRQALQQALDDLRLMIDSMDDVGGDLLTVLGMLRQRLEPRLLQAGLVLHWRVQELPELANFGPQKTLQVLRILQEAITNVIKHAQAHSITLSTGVTPLDGAEQVFVRLCDDGIGLPAEAFTNANGRGLRNMRRRAESIDASLEVEASTAGTCLLLSLPRT